MLVLCGAFLSERAGSFSSSHFGRSRGTSRVGPNGETASESRRRPTTPAPPSPSCRGLESGKRGSCWLRTANPGDVLLEESWLQLGKAKPAQDEEGAARPFCCPAPQDSEDVLRGVVLPLALLALAVAGTSRSGRDVDRPGRMERSASGLWVVIGRTAGGGDFWGELLDGSVGAWGGETGGVELCAMSSKRFSVTRSMSSSAGRPKNERKSGPARALMEG